MLSCSKTILPKYLAMLIVMFKILSFVPKSDAFGQYVVGTSTPRAHYLLLYVQRSRNRDRKVRSGHAKPDQEGSREKEEKPRSGPIDRSVRGEEPLLLSKSTLFSSRSNLGWFFGDRERLGEDVLKASICMVGV